MSSFLSFCGLAVVAAIAILIVKPFSDTTARMLVLASLVLLLAPILLRYSEMLTEIKELLSQSSLADYGYLLLKVLGVAFVVRLCADTCRGMGEETLASGVELLGKAEILLLCMPLLTRLLSLLREVMQ